MKTSIVAVSLFVIAAVGAAQSAAAEKPGRGSKSVPVEYFACNWVQGKGMQDLKVVEDRFRQWTQKNDKAYTAWVMTPQFHNTEGMSDIGWLGSWPSGGEFGAGQDAWMRDGRDVAAAFAGVVDCSSRHELASSVVVEAPDGPPENGVVLFAQCTLKPGATREDAFQAHGKLADAMKALGSKASTWLFYPGLGAGDIDFHYWRVVSFRNYAELGAAAEILSNGGGWQKTQEILGPVASCASATAFDARQVVAGRED